MIKRLSKWLFLNVWGWKVEGSVPDVPKYLIVVAPHTSNWDFLVGILFRKYTDNFEPMYLAKKELFVFPIGFFFRWTGGFPVERGENTNFVDDVVSVFDNNEKFCTTIAPEGTRSYRKKWKTGFYYMAKNAKIPILRIAFDYPSKTLVLDELYYITKDADSTVNELKEYFSKYKGKNPQNGVIWPE